MVLLDSFSVVGYGAFKKRWSVSVGELRGIIAVTGINGIGKSTFLEMAVPGALYRQTPTRGSLVDLATARDACLDVGMFHAGERFQFRHLADGQSGKSEVLVTDAKGAPVLSDSKVRSFDAWVAKTFPAPEVLLSTIFGAQGSGGFLAAKPAERKAILLRVLGVERLERLAAEAREKTKSAKAAWETTNARLSDERARTDLPETVEALLASNQSELAGHEQALAAAQAQLVTAQEQTKNFELVQQANAATQRQRAGIEQRLVEARAKVKDLDERLTNNRAVLADSDAIKAAVARVAELQAEIATAERAAATAEAQAREALSPWLDVNERNQAAFQRSQRATSRLRDRAAIETAQLELPNLRDAEEEANRDVTRLVAEVEALDAEHLASADEREQKLLEGVDSVWQAYDANVDVEASDLAALARETREEHDTAVALVTSMPARRKELKERLAAARDRQAKAQRDLAEAERLAGRAGDLVGAEEERDEADRELAAMVTGYDAARATARAQRATADAERAKVAPLTAELSTQQTTAARARRLEEASGRISALEPERADAAKAVEALTAELEGVAAPAELPPQPDTLEAHQRVKYAQQNVDQARSAIARAEQRLEEARASATRRAEMETQLLAQQLELADWTRVAADLGKDGLQALEIDAAGPELTAIANELLHECHSHRFTLRVETQRASADGKRTLEGCDVMVLDTVAGREAAGETFSGGERVVLAEALALAITVLACRRSGLSDVSLVRDESGAALDAGNARVYVAMLRKAVEMIGARHCLLVSHMPEVQELCDHRIEVGSSSAEARAA